MSYAVAHATISLIGFVLSLIFSIKILGVGRAKSHIIFSFLFISTAIFFIGDFFLNIDFAFPLLWSKIKYIGVVLIPLSILLLSQELRKIRVIPDYLAYILSGIFIVLILFSNFIISEVVSTEFGYNETYGSGGIFLFFYLVLLSGFGFFTLLDLWSKTKYYKSRMLWIAIGVLIGIVAVFTDVLMTVIGFVEYPLSNIIILIAVLVIYRGFCCGKK